MNIDNSINSILLNQLNISTTASTKSVSKLEANAINKLASSCQEIKSPITVETVSSAIDTLENTTEENVVIGLDLIQTANDALNEMSNNLSYLREILNDSENYNDEYGVLEWLDEQSNALINNILELFNTTEYNGVKLFTGIQSGSSMARLDNYQNFVLSLGNVSDSDLQLIINTKLNLDGLSQIQNMSLDDENYIATIDELIAEINAKREDLNSDKQTLDSIAQSIYEKSDKILSDTESITSSDMQKQVLINNDSLLSSFSEGISPEVVLGLLNNK